MTTTSEATNRVTTITNQGNTEFGSDLLEQIAALSTSAYNAPADKQTIQVAGRKGELVTALVVHLVGDVIFELLRLATKRLVNHPLYDPLISLNIDGRPVALQDVIDEK